MDRPHHIAEPRRQARLLAAITRINVQFFRTWGFANNFLKIGIFGGGKQLLLGRLIGSELLHQLPCRTLDNLNFAIAMGDTHMVEDFLPDLFVGAHRFDDLDPGPIEFGIMFGAYEHAANDIVVVTSLDRLARSTPERLRIVEALMEKNRRHTIT